MSKKYFVNCQTLEELKKEYKKLAMMYHPDRPNGNEEIMKAVNNEYEMLFNILKEKQEVKEDKLNNENSAEFINIINELIHCEGLEIELTGTWCWLSGNTYQYKNIIKGLGFKWASAKKMWYLKPENYVSSKHKAWDMDKIRNTYGSQKVETKKAYAIA
jgi:hypothetical protein